MDGLRETPWERNVLLRGNESNVLSPRFTTLMVYNETRTSLKSERGTDFVFILFIIYIIELSFNETQSIVSHETAGQMNANPIIAEFTRLR